jgi:DNA-binding LacI/PurR family transcriptional regulator
VEHLVSLGHRDIAFIGQRPDKPDKTALAASTVESEHLQGYLDVIAEAGLPSQVLLGAHSTREVDFQSPGRRYAEEILASAKRLVVRAVTCREQ